MRDRALLAAAVVVGLALIGFLRGTQSDDYDLSRPEALPAQSSDAPTYASLRDDARPEDIASHCSDCHPEQLLEAGRGQRTQHPIGVTAPAHADLEALQQAGGRVGVEGEVQCRSCHRPHDLDQDGGLVVTTDEGVLCLSCHADRGADEGEHPAGVQGCLQCHDPHDATSGSLLRTHSRGDSACRECHGDHAEALGDEGHGEQACVSCHGMHRARILDDPPCLSCHDDGGRFALLAGSAGHGTELACADCHQTHSDAPALAPEGVSTTCLGCHEDFSAVLGSAHDPPSSKAGSGCASCHAPHRVTAPVAGVNPASAPCLACHEQPQQHASDLLLTVSGLPHSGQSPYFSADGSRTRGVGELTCQSCHAPPSGAENFLVPGVEVWCTTCHGEETEDHYKGFHDTPGAE